ncbi:pilus assembly FimT family protein [Tautonia sociabilis]|uniref:Prepilin-type N-terminal cleavage/methylation domain-containing protein n=1 Tax=Tautonia sociabilis TaxID=2080755 RepID=A0A432MDC2_9BACT|nr:prepilin-type N-terminal cleavage/methylation domain-containing protein [Tautonia sociabilis]RUL82039.1 prepilin-type N-terminal cleavage/methylation domain-containing protein [Tautonia sociabilis]
MLAPRTPRPSGMTLTELLVVIAIILLVSAATLPTAYVAFAEREVSEAANLVQGNFKLSRDRATGTGQPQGIRFVPDPDLTDFSSRVVASNRMLTLTTPPNYSEGLVIPIVEIWTPPFIPAGVVPNDQIRRLALYGAKLDNDKLPIAPTSWYFNIRQGERVRLDGAGNEYLVSGPITLGPASRNPERFVNQTGNLAIGTTVRALPTNTQFEILYIVNGRDDPDPPSNPLIGGYTDPHFNGVDDNGDEVIDPGYDGVDNNGNGFIDEPAELLFVAPSSGLPVTYVEYEEDAPILDSAFRFARVNGYTMGSNGTNEPYAGTGMPGVVPLTDLGAAPIPLDDPALLGVATPPRNRYVISRRPSVATDAREYALPTGAVIDLTTSELDLDLDPLTRSERSRVPIDPVTGYLDLVIYPNGQVIPSTPYGFSRALDAEYPLFFLWIASREDVAAPVDPDPSTPMTLEWPLLPLPRESNGPGSKVLQGERRLVTISPTSGYASVSEVPSFGVFDPSDSTAVRAFKREIPYTEARQSQVTGR